MSSFGLGSFLGASTTSLGFAGVGYPVGGFGVYDYFPTWNAGDYSSWGLGSVASDWLYSDYTNPYNATVVAAQPAQTTVIFDYSQPINVAAPAPEASVAESTEQVFAAARDAFYAGDYSRAIELADQVIKETPNVPVVHEFRALALFALQRYDEAASVEYAVLTAGPGWNWSTLVGLYPDVETYTGQLRKLEDYIKANPNSASARFLLADHYMVQGHNDEAYQQFNQVAQLQPNDHLSASFVKALGKTLAAADQQDAAATPGQAEPGPAVASAPAAATPATPAEPKEEEKATESPGPPPPPPASMAGTWKAQPTPDVSIALTLKEDGGFTWDVDEKGKKQSLQGHAGFKEGTLALLHESGPPLVGKVTQSSPDKFVFSPPGADDKTSGLTFTR